jgi:hypothetical protein
MDEEWDQRRADGRKLATMRRIARDAARFDEDDDAEYWNYAAEHNLTANEVVYYLNAYEAGGDAGLEAIRNPDIIPAPVARRAIQAITKTLDGFLEGRIPYRITDEGTAIGVYEIRRRMNGEQHLFAICQLRLTLASNQWHLYWQRSFDAWWPYPFPETGHEGSLAARLQQVTEDKDGCFWG